MTGQTIGETKEVLVLVKAYPALSKRYGEIVCTAGITRDGKWIRLYPIPFRDLERAQKYTTWQWVSVEVTQSDEKLRRPESFKVTLDSLEPHEKMLPGKHWPKREEIFLPMVSKSLEELEELKKTQRVSLGAFRPAEVYDLIIEKDDEEWDRKKSGILSQPNLFKPKTPLEKIPYIFKYTFKCNDVRCNGHTQQIFDWAIYETYRNFKKTYGNESTALTELKRKWFTVFFQERESYFVVGTDSVYNHFHVLTVVSPKRILNTAQTSLF